jgi:hypothetical protein
VSRVPTMTTVFDTTNSVRRRDSAAAPAGAYPSDSSLCVASAVVQRPEPRWLTQLVVFRTSLTTGNAICPTCLLRYPPFPR